MPKLLTTLTVCLVMAAPAWAQGVPRAPGGGCPGGGTPEIPDPNKGHAWLKLRYYSPDGRASDAWKKSVEALKLVKRFHFEEDAGLLHCQVADKPEMPATLESSLKALGIPALVVNRARVLVGFASPKGIDPDRAKAAFSKLEGVHSVDEGPDGFTLLADLTKLSHDALVGAARQGGFEPVVNRTYEFVRYQVRQGNPDEFRTRGLNLRGVLTCGVDADTGSIAGLWVHKGLLKKLDALEKLPGFQVERLANPPAPTGGR